MQTVQFALKTPSLIVLLRYDGRPKVYFISGELQCRRPDLVKGHTKEFLASIDRVHTSMVETLVQGRFQRRGVLAENDRMDIEKERHTCISQFSDPIEGLKTPRQPYLVNFIAKRSDITDDVDMATPRLLGQALCTLFLRFCFLELCFKDKNPRFKFALIFLMRRLELLPRLLKQVAIDALLLHRLRHSLFVLTNCLLFFAHLFTDQALFFVFLRFLKHVLVDKAALLELQIHVRQCYAGC